MASNLAPGWRTALLAALEHNSHHKFTKYCQLATVRPDGKPANRTVVYRGFVDDTDQLHFWTDVRSNKVEEIAQNPWGEICWYFVDTWEQFRVAGKLHVIGPDEADSALQKFREQVWFATSPKQRTQFANPPPGQPQASDEEFPDQISEDLGPLPAFGVLTLDPVQVDYLQLKANQRRKYDLENGKDWKEDNINP